MAEDTAALALPEEEDLEPSRREDRLAAADAFGEARGKSPEDLEREYFGDEGLEQVIEGDRVAALIQSVEQRATNDVVAAKDLAVGPGYEEVPQMVAASEAGAISGIHLIATRTEAELKSLTAVPVPQAEIAPADAPAVAPVSAEQIVPQPVIMVDEGSSVIVNKKEEPLAVPAEVAPAVVAPAKVEAKVEDAEVVEPSAEELGLAKARSEIGVLIADMKRAEKEGRSEEYHGYLKKIAESKRNLIEELRRVPNPTESQRDEIRKLEVEIAQNGKKQELATEQLALAQLEAQKKMLDEKILQLEKNGSPEELAAAIQERGVLEAEIAKKKATVGEIQNVSRKYDSVLSSYGGGTSYEAAGSGSSPGNKKGFADTAEAVVQKIGAGIVDPGDALVAITNKILSGK